MDTNKSLKIGQAGSWQSLGLQKNSMKTFWLD